MHEFILKFERREARPTCRFGRASRKFDTFDMVKLHKFTKRGSASRSHRICTVAARSAFEAALFCMTSQETPTAHPTIQLKLESESEVQTRKLE